MTSPLAAEMGSQPPPEPGFLNRLRMKLRPVRTEEAAAARLAEFAEAQVERETALRRAGHR